MVTPEGNCWLCGKYGELTREHIPPKKAFNEFPVLFEKVAERSCQTGVLQWETAPHGQRGLCFPTLCKKCNNTYGSIYGESYVHLVKRIAERIGDVQEFHQANILGVKRPLRILKQVMLQFVTANGPNFVRSNEWVAPFIRERKNTSFPRSVYVYVFASNHRLSRKTGVSAHVDLIANRTHVTAEFTFWPLGTVMSFGSELVDKRLTPIHHWSQYPFDYSKTVDLQLWVNPVASPYPLDFRTAEQVRAAATEDPDVNISAPSDEDMQEMIRKAMRISGEVSKDKWIYSGHPSTVDMVSGRNKRTRS